MDGLKNRLLEFLKSINIGQKKFEQKVGLSNGFTNNVGDNITFKSLNKITSVYPELNTNWLLTGEGQMLKPSETREVKNEVESPNHSSEAPGEYVTDASLKDIALQQLELLKKIEVSLDYNTKRILINEAISRTHLHHSARVEARSTGQKYQDLIADLNRASEAIFQEIFSSSESALQGLMSGG